MRIGIAGISHETNTYCAQPTTLDDFTVLRGEEVVTRAAGTRTYVGGMLDAAGELGIEAVPLVVAGAAPFGVITSETYTSLKDAVLKAIGSVLPLDAVVLDLHGAGIADGVDDLEGDLVRAVRDVAGRGTWCVATFDLHGNLTEDMVSALDLGFGVHLYPHTDMYERGHEAVSHVPRLVDGDLRPVSHLERLPMLLPASTTDREPASLVNELCARIESRPGVVDCTFFHGFPYTDVPCTGPSVYVTTHDDADLARACAQEVASFVWDNREAFKADVRSPVDAIAEALGVEGRPVVINETSDNAGGAAPGDGTHLLRAMLDAGLEEACFSFIRDPEVVDAAHAAGVGATIDVRLGGKTDDVHGEPIETTATVRCLTDGKVTMRAIAQGLRVDLGPTARLAIGGVDVVVAGARSQTADPEFFLIHGIDVTRYRIVAVKSSQHFRAGFAPLAAAIITADPPGLTTQRPEVFPRHRNPWPLWPLHDDAAYTPA